MSRLALRYAVRSDRGLVRGNNEDSVYAGPRLLALADGMGGHAGGEVASKIVIAAMERLDEDRPIDDLITTLRDAVADANHSLAATVARDPDLDGMGTTLTALRFTGARVGLVHVGDSRGYLLRDGRLTQITHDDTYVQSLVDVGRLTLDEAFHHPRKSVILRALSGVDVDPDVSIREAHAGDRYLLCSDGLTDVVRAETLLEALSEGGPQDCADRLVQLALRGGGPDNVTCVVADVVDGDGDDEPVVAGAVVDAGDDSADDESPAARAAGRREPGAEPAPVARDRRLAHFVVPTVIVVVLVVAAVSIWMWTQAQYFVGPAGDSVAVFRGVDSTVGPVHFYRVVTRSDVAMDDLKPVARNQVAAGINAKSRAEAFAIVARLKDDQQLPPCQVTSAPAPSRTPTPSPRATTPSPRATTPSRARSGPTSRRGTPRSTARTTAVPSTARPETSRAATETAQSPQPSIDCRAGR